MTPRPHKRFGAADPLTPDECALILAENSAGASVGQIRRALATAGTRRGYDTIATFLRQSGRSVTGRVRPVGGGTAGPPPALTPQTPDYHCQFCEWRGPHSTYYPHWRLHHRTRSGFTRGDIARHAAD